LDVFAADVAQSALQSLLCSSEVREVLLQRLTMIGQSLVQHWSLDLVNGMHSHNHATALHFASLVDGSLDLARLREVVFTGNWARHAPLGNSVGQSILNRELPAGSVSIRVDILEAFRSELFLGASPKSREWHPVDIDDSLGPFVLEASDITPSGFTSVGQSVDGVIDECWGGVAVPGPCPPIHGAGFSEADTITSQETRVRGEFLGPISWRASSLAAPGVSEAMWVALGVSGASASSPTGLAVSSTSLRAPMLASSSSSSRASTATFGFPGNDFHLDGYDCEYLPPWPDEESDGEFILSEGSVVSADLDEDRLSWPSLD
jgi:hypothetical protein